MKIHLFLFVAKYIRKPIYMRLFIHTHTYTHTHTHTHSHTHTHTHTQLTTYKIHTTHTQTNVSINSKCIAMQAITYRHTYT